MFLILIIERSAERICGGALSWWRRHLIPLPIEFFLIANLDGDGCKVAAFVRAVAEWLILGLPARAPMVVLTNLDIHGHRGFLDNDGFAHHLIGCS